MCLKYEYLSAYNKSENCYTVDDFNLRSERMTNMKRAVIGITTFITGDSMKLPTTYINAVTKSEGVPIVLAKTEFEDQIKTQIDSVDGLLLTGGDDIDASLFGEDPHQNLGNIEPGRDAYEMKLIEYALEQDKPILAICRGAQILNISQGGTMYQDIYDQIETTVIQHRQNAPRNYLSHTVHIDSDSKLAEITGETEIKTNSFHHQANKDVPKGYIISAKTNDGVVEAAEDTNRDFVLALQWHPEASFDSDPVSQKIFKRFIETALK